MQKDREENINEVTVNNVPILLIKNNHTNILSSKIEDLGWNKKFINFVLQRQALIKQQQMKQKENLPFWPSVNSTLLN